MLEIKMVLNVRAWAACLGKNMTFTLRSRMRIEYEQDTKDSGGTHFIQKKIQFESRHNLLSFPGREILRIGADPRPCCII